MPTLTLTSTPAMKAHLEKVAPLLARSASTAPLTRPPPAPLLTRPVGAHPKPQPTPLADPELAARRALFHARQNTLFLRLRQLAPALFADPPPPMAIGIHKVLVDRLDLDAAAQRDLGCILRMHIARWSYQKALAEPGAVRLDLDGHPAGEVTAANRAEAVHELALLKAKAKAARDSRAPPRRAEANLSRGITGPSMTPKALTRTPAEAHLLERPQRRTY
jgi:hypothetical protein